MNLDLTGKRAFVGGSSKGIGQAIAVALAEQGAQVVLAARSADQLEAVRASLAGSGHVALAVDYTHPEQVRSQLEAALASGPIHILINNTGGPPGGPLIDASPNTMLDAFGSHLLMNHMLAQLLVPGMRQAGYGRIVNVISTSVKQPIPGLGVSNTVRGAVASWAKTLAGELGPFGITVNNVLPGFTGTQRLDEIIDSKSAKTGKSAEEVVEGMKSTVPLRRIADASEIAAAAAFLASPAASYINGINVPVDGGRTGSL